MHCPDGPICSACVAEVERLRPTASAAGEQLARRLASHVVPELPWVDSLDEKSEPIMKRIRTLSADARIVHELAVICACAARAEWESLREARKRA